MKQGLVCSLSVFSSTPLARPKDWSVCQFTCGEGEENRPGKGLQEGSAVSNHMIQSSTPCFNYMYPFQHSAFHVYLFLNRFLINLFLICLFSKVNCCVSFSASCAVSGGISMRYRKVLRMAEGSGAWLQIVKSKWNCPMKVPLQEVQMMCSWVCFDTTGLQNSRSHRFA